MPTMYILVFCSIVSSCQKNTTSTNLPTPTPVTTVNNDFYVRGIDMSFTPEIAETNTVYKDNGTAKPILTLVKDKGINTVRVRIWNNPKDVHSSLAEVTSFAKQLKTAGLKFWLDFHYADDWADPGKQPKPAAWTAADINALKDSVYNYTKNVLTTLKQNNVSPDYIQIGNEINNGILWSSGKVNPTQTTNWTNFTQLLQQGIKAAREITPNTKLMLHYAGYQDALSFFDKINSAGLDYDIIGLSYYPWWHGTNFDSLSLVMNNLKTTYKKPVQIAETSYPFTLQYNDYTGNVVGSADKLMSGYAATAQGQAQFIADVSKLVKKNATSADFGICYWAGDWVAFRGKTATNGSTWENLALFDFNNNALPALDSLGK